MKIIANRWLKVNSGSNFKKPFCDRLVTANLIELRDDLASSFGNLAGHLLTLHERPIFQPAEPAL